MRVLGAALPRAWQTGGPGEGTIVALGDAGDVQAVRRARSIAQSAEVILELAASEPFLAGVDLPVVVPEKESRVRPVENLVRRRLGVRLPPGGRAALVPGRGGVAGEALLAALSAAGHPCLPYPDRDRLRSGLAEIHAPLVLKALLWEGSALARANTPVDREDVLLEYAVPDYAPGSGRSRATWIERLSTIDVALRALGPVDGFDARAVREAMGASASADDLDRAAALLDASLIATAARRYLDEPETCVFLGDRESGYTILPADALVRRVALKESSPARSRLFPRASLRERLGAFAELKPLDLLPVPGRPERLEAVFHESPLHEFDNLDEMLWWKHCRHLAGPELPVEGLQEMIVLLDPQAQPLHETPLRLVRSRHRTLSFRFEPPRVWRARVPTRDGRTYAFRVLRAVYETRAAAGA